MLASVTEGANSKDFFNTQLVVCVLCGLLPVAFFDILEVWISESYYITL